MLFGTDFHRQFSKNCLSSHLQGPREPFEGFISAFGHSSAFTTDSPVPESTVISRHRPRLPSVSTGLLSMDMLLIVTVFSSISSGSPLFIVGVVLRSGFLWNFVKSTFSLTGDVILVSCSWQLLAVHTQLFDTEQTVKFTERQPSARDTDFSAFCAAGIRLLKKYQTAHPNNQREKTLRRLGNRCHGTVSTTSYSASLCTLKSLSF